MCKSGRYPAVMRLAVGDLVVYASHGAGRVAAREKRIVLGKRQEVVVLVLAGGLSVELPMERAHELLRPLVTEADMSRVQTALGAAHAANSDPWLKRRRESQAKLTSGDPIELAELIRDSAHRESTPRAKSQLSPAERDVFVKARQLLSNEIALARGVEPAEANANGEEERRARGCRAQTESRRYGLAEIARRFASLYEELLASSPRQQVARGRRA